MAHLDFGGLSKVKCRHQTWLIPHTQKGQVHPFPRRGINVLYLEANRGYWRVEIESTDPDKISFASHHWLYRLSKMLLGPRNAPGIFQRTVEVLFSPVKWQLTIVYLDDIIIFQELEKNTSTMFAPYYCCCIEQSSPWTWRLQDLYRRDRILGTFDTPRPIRARFSYHGRNTRLKTTCNSNGIEFILWLFNVY